MQIQELTSADLEFISELQPPDWRDITPNLRLMIQSDICFPIKVVENNRMIGIGVRIMHPEVAWLAMIIVHPEYRSKGIGKLITETLIEDAMSAGYERVYLVATPLGYPMYTKLGFQTEAEYSFTRNEEWHMESPVSSYIVPFSEEHTEDIFRLDRMASDEDRSERIKDYLNDSFVYLRDEKVHGFYLPSFFEGLIVASGEEAGIELMKLRLNSPAFGNVAILPMENLPARKFLGENGFNEFRTAQRMYLGKKINWKPGLIYNRVGGQIG